MKTNDFKQKTKYIFDLLLESKITYYKAELEKFLEYQSNFRLENLTNNSFLLYSYDHSYLKLFIKNEISNSFTEKSNIYVDHKIISFNFSPDKKTIYTCSSEKKAIDIFNYESNYIYRNSKRIEMNSYGYFNKCIHINDNCLVAIDDNYLYFFEAIYSGFINKNIFTLKIEFMIYVK